MSKILGITSGTVCCGSCLLSTQVLLKSTKRSYSECSIRSIFVYNCPASLVIVKVQRDLTSTRDKNSRIVRCSQVDVRDFLSRRREVFSGRRESSLASRVWLRETNVRVLTSTKEKISYVDERVLTTTGAKTSRRRERFPGRRKERRESAHADGR